MQREYTVGVPKNRLQAFADECQDPPQDLFADQPVSSKCATSVCASCVERLFRHWCVMYLACSHVSSIPTLVIFTILASVTLRAKKEMDQGSNCQYCLYIIAGKCV